MSAEPVGEEVDVESTETTRSVPYMSFHGFRSLVDRLGADGVPQVFDRSFFGHNQSGSLTAQTRGTLRFFELISEDKRPTATLIDLARADESRRKEILRGLAEVTYADAIALGTNATQGQLADVFRATGLSGESITKAINFYVGLADYVGLEVSPFFKSGRPSAATGNGGSSRRATRRRRTGGPTAEPQAERKPDPVVPPLAMKQSAYIDLLMKLVETRADNGQGEVQKDLLDRLERALGYDAPQPEKGSP